MLPFRLNLLGLTLACLTALAIPTGGEALTPEGRWTTWDDRTGRLRSVVRVTIEGGLLRGFIERILLRPDEGPDPVCVRCPGVRTGRKVVGMDILWGHHQDGERWTGGTILDPENGKEYSSTLWLEGSEILRVRGHWGPFHRTQTWRRLKGEGELP